MAALKRLRGRTLSSGTLLEIVPWIAALCLFGAIGLPGQLGASQAEGSKAHWRLEKQIKNLGLDPAEILQPLQIDDTIRAWAQKKIPRGAPELIRLRILLEQLQHGDELNFEYQAGYTGSAREVFHSGRYNCLSFSILFVSMARELGLPAFYLVLDNVESYEKEGDLIVASQHITAGYGFVRDRTILEFDVGPEINYQLAEPISDLDALALFYSNRGAELLRDGKTREALEMHHIATTLGPELFQTWINRGVTERRLNDLEGAESSYLQALDVGQGNVVAYENLVALMRLKGEDNLADQMLPRLAQRKNHNPYTYLKLGDLSLRDGRVDEARRFYKRAFRLARYEAETHAAMGISALADGRREKAEQWLEKAIEIDADNDRIHELQGLLDADQRTLPDFDTMSSHREDPPIQRDR